MFHSSAFMRFILLIALVVFVDPSFALQSLPPQSAPSVPTAPKSTDFSIDTQRQLLFLKVDAAAAQTAEELSYVFLYLHRKGVDLTPDKWVSPLARERQKRAFMRGLITDSKFRASAQSWLRLFGSNIKSIADPLGETEAYVLSRDAFSQALLRSHRFDQRLREISEIEKFDFRPVVRRTIREFQFTSDGVFILASGGLFGFLFKALGIVKAGIAVSAVSTAVIGGTVIWDLSHAEQDTPPSGETLLANSASSSRETQENVAIAKEIERRLVLVACAAELNKNLSANEPPPCLREMARIRPQLVEYLNKLQRDELPIKLKDDELKVRADIERSVSIILHATAS